MNSVSRSKDISQLGVVCNWNADDFLKYLPAEHIKNVIEKICIELYKISAPLIIFLSNKKIRTDRKILI